MKKEVFQIPFPEGFHARPASSFVSAVKDFESAVTIVKDGKEVDGKSMIQLMTLGAKCGDRIEVIVDGSDESEAMEVIKEQIGGTS
ncbi:MAG: HPr family phosphocarrier protein [Bacillaceae bacterium]|nr:HPr family phosphocarrier protein [Bacillaceae bacterium]